MEVMPTVSHLVVSAAERSVTAVQVAPDVFVVPGQADVQWSGADAALVGRDLVHGVQFVQIRDTAGVEMPELAETSPAVGQQVMFSGAQIGGAVSRVEQNKFWVACDDQQLRPGTPVMCADGDWHGIVVGANPTVGEIEVLDVTAIRESYDENWAE